MAAHITADFVVVGAGIAGAGVAAGLAPHGRVVLLEMESRPGHHTTGRSAAIFIQNYGGPVIRALSRASAALFRAADPELFPNPLLSPRGMLNVSDEAGLPHHAALLAESEGLVEIFVAEALALVPILRADAIRAASYEADAMDIDVAALHQGWLKAAKRGSAQLLTDTELLAGRRVDGAWQVETKAGTVSAPVLVNAAGAWADEVAARCGLPRLGLTPLRRSMAVLPAPEGHDSRRWPLFGDAAESWYAKPDGGRLFVSPADEDPVEPHDAFPDDMVLAEGLFRFEQAVTVPVTHVERSWAGLRTFAPDRTPVAGYDPAGEGFFWLAGQGGYGIQTAPALSALAAASIRGAAAPDFAAPLLEPLSPARFR